MDNAHTATNKPAWSDILRAVSEEPSAKSPDTEIRDSLEKELHDNATPQRESSRTAPPNVATAKGFTPSSRRLLTPTTETAVGEAFKKLTQTILLENTRAVDSAVNAMLVHQIQEWIDQRLPSLAERLVKDEIERASQLP